MRRIITALGAFAALSLLVASSLSAAVPDKITVQGRLTNSAGSPVPNGSYTITFSLWDAASGGAMLLSEIQSVQVNDGLFSANLQYDVEKLGIGPARYLQYQILGDPPISPRILLTTSPYSFITSRVNGDIETSSGNLKVKPDATSTSNLALVGDSDQDLFTASAKPYKTYLSLHRNASPESFGRNSQAADIALVSLVANTHDGAAQVDGGMVAITGDPDFDLLRLTATQDSAKIRISAKSSGDPDFDLLRIVAGGGPSSGGAEMAMGGDPDFDLLRISADKDSAKIRISGQSSGDPDFDLLRIVGGTGSSATGSSIVMTGDPDFDLLRVTADHDSAKIRLGGKITGDPDFDLLRIVGGGGQSHLVMQSEPSGALGGSHSLSADCDDISARLFLTAQPPGPTTVMVQSTNAAAHLSMGSGDPNSGVNAEANADSASLRVGSAFYLDGTRSTDDEVVRTFSWKQTSGPLALRMEMRADSLSSTMLCRGLLGRDVLLRSDNSGAAIQIEDAANLVMMEMNGDGRLGVGKPADNVKRIDVAGGAFCNGTNWVNASDVNAKENFSPVDAAELLEKIAKLDITEWNYRGEDDQTRHIGPTAQDFYRLFGTGNDDKSISTIDPAGVSLAAIKELYKKSKEVDQLKQQVEELSRQLLEIREQLKKK